MLVELFLVFWGDFLSIASELLQNNYTGGSGF